MNYSIDRFVASIPGRLIVALLTSIIAVITVVKINGKNPLETVNGTIITGLIVLGLTSVLAVACAEVGGAGDGPATSADVKSQGRLEDLAGIDDLKARFNEDVGAPRLLLLMSPT